MRTNPQRAAYAAIKLTFASCAIFYPALGQAQQDKPVKTLKEVTVRADWLGSSTPQTAKKHPGARTVITSQELTEERYHEN